MKITAILLTAALAATLLSSCSKPKRIFHGGYEVATPMSEVH